MAVMALTRLALLVTAGAATSPVLADQPVRVFILLGQSNMLGEGKVIGNENGTLQYAVETEGLYPYLLGGPGFEEAAQVHVAGRTELDAPNPEAATCDASGFEKDTDYHDGQGIAHTPGESAADCCTQCSNATGCKFFTFAPVGTKGSSQGICWLKADANGRRGVKGCVSGSVYGVPSPPPPPPSPPPSPPSPPPIHWAVRRDVRNVFIMGNGNATFESSKLEHNEWLSVNTTIKSTIGPELGIGNMVGDFTDAPTMILKSCIGNRALGWDLLPPGSKEFDFTDSSGVTWTYAGYGESPEKWKKGDRVRPPAGWSTGEQSAVGWYAGEQYDGDIARAKRILADLDAYYPGATRYEVAGFFWWQGDKDSRDEGLSSRYEVNLVNFIQTLRKDFNAPNAKFVTASLGQSVKGDTDGAGKILDAMLAVDGKSGKYPEFQGNVAAVYTHPLSKGSSSGAHYGGNAETYMNVGEAMGNAMVELLKAA